MSKLNISSLEMSNSSAESVENFNDTSILLHGDDSELILLVNPDQESLSVIVEDTSARWPVSIEVASSEESVSLPIFEITVSIFYKQYFRNKKGVELT